MLAAWSLKLVTLGLMLAAWRLRLEVGSKALKLEAWRLKLDALGRSQAHARLPPSRAVS